MSWGHPPIHKPTRYFPPYNSILSYHSLRKKFIKTCTVFFTMQPFLSHNPDNSLLQHQPLWVSRFGFYTCCELKKRGSGTNNNFLPNRAADRDSVFEIDPDKAREALRKLDQQLDLISQKQTNPVPKIKASSPYSTRDDEMKDMSSFLPYGAFGLLIFTIFYNILFATVIKPSVDGPQGDISPAGSSIMTQVLKSELLQLQPSPDQPSTSTLFNSD